MRERTAPRDEVRILQALDRHRVDYVLARGRNGRPPRRSDEGHPGHRCLPIPGKAKPTRFYQPRADDCGIPRHHPLPGASSRKAQGGARCRPSCSARPPGRAPPTRQNRRFRQGSRQCPSQASTSRQPWRSSSLGNSGLTKPRANREPRLKALSHWGRSAASSDWCPYPLRQWPNRSMTSA